MGKARQPRSRGQIIQKGPDKFLLRVTLGKDADTGRRLFDSKVFTGTLTDAQAELGIMQAGRDTNSFVKPNTHTVASFWKLFIGEKRNLSANTKGQYQTRADRDIIPHLGDVALSDLEPSMVSRWVTWMETEREHGARTIRYSYSLLFSMYELALTWNLVARNPVKAELPKKSHEEMLTLTPAEAVALLDTAEESEDPLYALWSLLLNAGCRPQEAFALTWADIQGRKVTLSKAVVQGRDKEGKPVWEIGPTKTKAGRRTITIPKECVDALKAHQQRTGGIGGTLVFKTASGGFLDIANVRKAWTRACKRAQVTEVRLYDARHTHATILLTSNTHPKTVSARLGHASVQVTMDVYSHVMPEVDEGAADELEAVLKKARQA